MRGAIAALHATRRWYTVMRTSLAGLWLERSRPDAAGDSLRALTDEVMRTGQYLVAAEALDRLVVARLLRKAR